MTTEKKNQELGMGETLVQGAPAHPTPGGELAPSPAASGAPPLLAGRYRILGLIGRGGMGAVYRALDTELDELVALKMLKTELGASELLLERFRREVKLARRVTHPNVARMFDIGEHDGVKFLTMELIEGETLTELAARSGRLPLPRVLGLAGSICAGLAAAHQAGVVHRDLKPDNVMVARDGRVVITDFGIARDPLASGDRHTSGGVVGTPAYMAPEQVEAAPDIDARADLYALGVMLFELLTGELPWKATSPLALAAARLHVPPAELRSLRPDLPPGIAAVLARCLARDRNDRHRDAAEVAVELAQLSPTLPQAVPSPRPSALPPSRTSTPPESGVLPGTSEKTVAVLPFRNRGSSDDDFVADGLTEDLIDTLSMTRGLRVRPRSAVQRYKGAELDPRDIGRELGVEVVVEGSVLRSGERMRLAARLTSVEDGFQLWAQRFDRPSNDLLVVSDETARAIADALTVHAAKSKHVVASDAEAVELYLRARAELSELSAEHVLESLSLFQSAHERSPHDIAILSGFARASARVWFFQGTAPPDAAERARELAERAVQVAPRDPEALLALATVRLMDQDSRASAEACRQALRVAPDNAEAHEQAGRLLLEAGQPEAALGHLERAAALDPSLLPTRMELARAHALLGDFSTALALTESTPGARDYASAAVARARMVLWAPEIREALRGTEVPAGAPTSSAWLMVQLAINLARGMPVEGAIEFMAKMSEQTRGAPRFRAVLCQILAELQLHFGQSVEALGWIEESIASGLVDLTWLDRCPAIAALRSEPRFQQARVVVAGRARDVVAALGASDVERRAG